MKKLPNMHTEEVLTYKLFEYASVYLRDNRKDNKELKERKTHYYRVKELKNILKYEKHNKCT
jgi:hypothetical protein